MDTKNTENKDIDDLLFIIVRVKVFTDEKNILLKNKKHLKYKCFYCIILNVS